MNDVRRHELQLAIDRAVRPLVPNVEQLQPGTVEGIVEDVANVAATLIDVLCGDPDAPRPQGILRGRSPLEDLRAGGRRWSPGE